jgi:hypothetical protein
LGELFLEHKGFLYNKENRSWLDEILLDRREAFNVLMKNSHGELKHFILKCQDIQQKNDYCILSFDDVSSLNLIEYFPSNEDEQKEPDKESIFNFLSVIHRNDASLSLHNNYKGISITNSASIVQLTKEMLVVKSSYIQQKAVFHEQKVLISSEALPSDILCSSVTVFFEKQFIECRDWSFVKDSPSMRQNIRVVPEESHSVILCTDEEECFDDCKIVDISTHAVKLRCQKLPQSIALQRKIVLKVNIEMLREVFNMEMDGVVLKVRENKTTVDVVVQLELAPKTKTSLLRYITKRQMAIIREFKGLKDG